jgi:hypothetical protein
MSRLQLGTMDGAQDGVMDDAMDLTTITSFRCLPSRHRHHLLPALPTGMLANGATHTDKAMDDTQLGAIDDAPPGAIGDAQDDAVGGAMVGAQDGAMDDVMDPATDGARGDAMDNTPAVVWGAADGDGVDGEIERGGWRFWMCGLSHPLVS